MENLSNKNALKIYLTKKIRGGCFVCWRGKKWAKRVFCPKSSGNTGLNQYKRFSKEDILLLLLLSAVKVRVFFLSPTEFVHFRPNFNGYLEKNTIYSSK